MKNIFGFLLFALILVSCTPKNEFVLEGTVSGREGLEGETIHFYRYDRNDVYEADSAIIKNNKFKIKGIKEEPAVFYVYIDAKDVYGSIALGVPVLVKQGKATFDIVGDKVVIGGHEENVRYQELLDKQEPILKHLDEISMKYEEATSEEEKENLQAENSIWMEKSKNLNIEFVKENINNEFGKNLFLDVYPLFTLEEAKELLSKTDESYSSLPAVQDIIAFLTPKSKFPKGTPYMDFTLFDMNGKKVSLSDYVGKGKYILVDFWASWCTPCMQEMPHLVEFYNEMKGEKFEIVGVSLDKDKNRWVNTVNQYNMTWPQMSDLKESIPAIKPYDVRYIPFTVLIDPEGKIVADGLIGEQLEKAVLQALNIPHKH